MYKIYFDFDGTLYNSTKLTNDFYNIFYKFGFNKERINIIKEELFKNKLFNLDKLTDYIINTYNVSNILKRKINELYKNDYLYDDVIESIKLLNNKYKLYILTYGSYQYQMNKIINSGINKYISDIIITEHDKSNLNTVDYKNGIFIDNNPKEICKFVNTKPYKVIRLRRNNDKYKNVDTIINNLEYNDLLSLINKELL